MVLVHRLACFITPLVVGLTVYTLSKRSKRGQLPSTLRALAYMLLGGAFLLAVEHVWHGEVTLYPPFLTAATGPQGLATLIRELTLVGMPLTAAVVALWAGLVVVANRFELVRTLIFGATSGLPRRAS